jgi:hypothetical protein
VNGKQLINALTQDWVSLDVEIGFGTLDSDGEYAYMTPSQIVATSRGKVEYVTMDYEPLNKASLDVTQTAEFWKKLLERYIAHVEDRWGINFLENVHMRKMPFTEEELAALHEVS